MANPTSQAIRRECFGKPHLHNAFFIPAPKLTTGTHAPMR